MKIIIALLCASLTACTVSSEELELTSTDGELLVLPPRPPVRVTTWSSTNPVRWPSGATRMQVILRRGEDSVIGRQSTAYAFVIGDGAVVTQALRVPLTQDDAFLHELDLVMHTREQPGSQFSHQIVGSLWVGPRPGPPGDELSPHFVTALLNSAAAIDGAADAALQLPM